MDYSIEECNIYTDERGILVQFIDERFLQDNKLPFGQIYSISFEGKNVVRGNHYHHYASETFCLINGEVELVIEDVVTKERFQLTLAASHEKVVRVRIGSKIAHAIKSISEYALMISYSSKMYSADDEDKVKYNLIQ